MSRPTKKPLKFTFTTYVKQKVSHGWIKYDILAHSKKEAIKTIIFTKLVNNIKNLI